MNAYENTDKEIWRKIEGDYYSPSIFVTKEGNVGISVGGNVYVQSVEEWHKQAEQIAELEKELNHMQSFYGCDPAYYGMKQTKP